MRLLRHPTSKSLPETPFVVAFDRFEGMHRGHQALIRRAAEIAHAHAGTLVAMIEDNRRIRRAGTSLDTLWQRLRGLGEQGVEIVIIYSSARWSELLACDVPITVAVLDASEAGEEFLSGSERRQRISFERIPSPMIDGRVVTTRATREAVLSGDLAQVRQFLGRELAVVGRVYRGFQRGRTIGFPTANLRTSGIALPPNGVYAVRVRVDGKSYGGVANLGVNPTFGVNDRTLESYLFDYAGDLYGRRIEVDLLQSLRGEKKFSGIDELKVQIGRDADAARAVLERW